MTTTDDHDETIRGHHCHGLATTYVDGVSTEPVYLRCEQIGTMTAENRARLDARPPLAACGRHDVPGVS